MTHRFEKTISPRGKSRNLARSLAFTVALGLSAIAVGADSSVEQRRRDAGQLLVAGKVEEAFRAFVRLAAEGDVDAKFMVADLYLRVDDAESAIRWLEPMAVAGDATAQWRLSSALRVAHPPDEVTADEWLRRAADNGNASAIGTLALTKELVSRPEFQGDAVVPSDMVKLMQRLIAGKVSKYNQETLACYGMSRADLVAANHKAMDGCLPLLRERWGDSVPSVDLREAMMQLAQCTNEAVFKHTSTSPNQLIDCLPFK